MKADCSRSVFALLLVLSLVPTRATRAQEWTGYVAAESRGYPQKALAAEQHGSVQSFVAQPEFYLGWSRGYQQLVITPFLRIDQGDPRRTHFDLRELFWRKAATDWEVTIGVTKVFWGVTESQHLVDVINQTDLVEQPDGEEKLGQPMINLSLIRRWGVVDLFLLPWFREKTYPGRKGRLRAAPPVDSDQVVYSSGAGSPRPDWAVRWSHILGAWDIGLSHFSGTARDPRFSPGLTAAGRNVLIPRYDVIQQSGLDVQATLGAWLWKLETIHRSGQGARFTAITGGFEYTFNNLMRTGADVGLLAEYLYDSRADVRVGGRSIAPVLFEDDIFMASRLAFNDVAGTQILGGIILDRSTGAGAVVLESSRRLTDRWVMDLEMRGSFNTSPKDLLHQVRKDDFIQFGLSWYL